MPTLGILAPTIFIVEFPLWLAVNVPPPDALPLVVTVNVPLPTDGIDGNVARFPWPVTYWLELPCGLRDIVPLEVIGEFDSAYALPPIDTPTDVTPCWSVGKVVKLPAPFTYWPELPCGAIVTVVEPLALNALPLNVTPVTVPVLVV